MGWRLSPAIPGNVRTFPGMQDRKTAEAGKNLLGPTEEKRKEKVRHLEKNSFLSVGEKKCPLEKKKLVGWRIFFCRLGKKMSVGKKLSLEKEIGWRISPAIPGNVRTFPGMQDRKTAEAEKKS